MNEKQANKNYYIHIIVCFCAYLIIAIIWPFIYPILGLILDLLGFGNSLGPLTALLTFGPLYGNLSETAPDFFKAMAEAKQQLSGEDPALTALPYIMKVQLLVYATIPFHVIEITIFVLAVAISLISRLFPWRAAKNGIQCIAIALVILPIIAIFLWCIFFFILPYIQTWQVGLLDFVLLIVLWPAVLIKVVSPSIGLLSLALGLVPVGLAFAGRDGLAGQVVSRFVD
jgi:hypothetical protein